LDLEVPDAPPNALIRPFKPLHGASPMNFSSIFLPALAMVLLTFVVMFRMARCRFAESRAKRIHPQSVATSAQAAARFEDTRAADNYRNLFELPVLFYVSLLTAHATGQTGVLVLGLAWLFVLLRVAHSVIHCSYNKVMHRFLAFLAGAMVLLALWVVLAIGLLG